MMPKPTGLLRFRFSRKVSGSTPPLWLTGFKDPAGLFDPTTVPGTNYAVAGATSALGAAGPEIVNINLPTQVAAYSGLVSDHADPNALYVVMIGGNDVRAAALGAGASAVTDGVAAEKAAISKCPARAPSTSWS